MLGTTKELGVGSIPHKLTTAVHGNKAKGKNYRCYQRGMAKTGKLLKPSSSSPKAYR